MGLPDPRDGRLRGSDARPRQRPRLATIARSTSSARASRSARSRRPTCSPSTSTPTTTTCAEGMHLETVLHTEVYKRRPDVRSVVHGHPPYATAFGATDAEFAYLTHDSVLFVDGISTYDGVPDLIVDAAPGGAGGRGARRRAPRCCCATTACWWPSATSAGRCSPACCSSARSSCRRSPATLGPLHPIPQRAARGRSTPTKYQDDFAGEYWDAWVRELRRSGRAFGMPGEPADATSAARQSTAARCARRVEPQGAAARLPARPARPDRRQALLRRPGLRHLHGARRRRAGQRLHLPRRRGARARGADGRGLRADARVRASSRPRSCATRRSSAATARPGCC